MKLTGLNILVYLEDDRLRKETAYLLNHYGANTFIASDHSDLRTIFSLWEMDLCLLDDYTHFNLTDNLDATESPLSRIVLTTKKDQLQKRAHVKFVRLPFSPQSLIETIHQHFWQIEDLLPAFCEVNETLKFTLYMNQIEIDVTHGEPKGDSFVVSLDHQFPMEQSGNLAMLDLVIPHNSKVMREHFVVKVQKASNELCELAIDEKDLYRWGQVIKSLVNDQEILSELLAKIKGT